MSPAAALLQLVCIVFYAQMAARRSVLARCAHFVISFAFKADKRVLLRRE